MNNVQIRLGILDDLNVLNQFEQELIKAERPFDVTLKSGHINYYDLKAMINSPDSEIIVG